MNKFQLEDQVRVLEQQLQRQVSLYQNARAESEEFQDMVKDFSLQIMELQKEADSLRTMLKGEEVQEKHLQQKLIEAEQRLAETATLLENESKMRLQLEGMRTSLEMEVASLHSQVENVKAEEKAQVEEMRNQMEELFHQIEEQGKAMENERHQSDLRIRDLEEAYNQSKQEALEAARALAIEKEKSKGIQNRLESVQEELRDTVMAFSKEKENMEEKIRSLTAQLQSASSAGAEGEAAIQEMMMQLRDAKVSEEEAKSILKKTEADLEKDKMEREQLTAKMTMQVRSAKAAEEEAKAILKKTQADLEKEKVERAQLAEKIKNMEELMKVAEKTEKKAVQGVASRSEGKVEDGASDEYESRLSDLRMQLELTTARVDEKMLMLEKERELAKKKETEFQLKEKEFKEKLTESEKRVAELKSLMETGKEEGENRVKKLAEKLTLAKKKTTETVGLLGQRSREGRATDELSAKLEASQNRVRELQRQLAVETSALEAKYEEARVKLREAEERVEKEREQYQAQMAEMKEKYEIQLNDMKAERRAAKMPALLARDRPLMEDQAGEVKVFPLPKKIPDLRRSVDTLGGGSGEREVTRRGLRGEDFTFGVDGLLSCSDDRLQLKLEEARRRAESTESPTRATTLGSTPVDKGSNTKIKELKQTKETDDNEKRTVTEHQALVEELKDKLGAAEESLAKMQEEKSKMGKEISELTEKVEEAEAKVAKMTSRLELAESWMVKDAQGNLLVPRDVERKLVMELKARLMEAEKRAEEVARSLSNTKASNVRKMEEMKVMLEAAERQASESMDANEASTKLIAELQSKLHLVETQLKEMTLAKDASLRQVEEMKQKLTERVKQLEQVKQKLEEVEILRTKEAKDYRGKLDALERKGVTRAQVPGKLQEFPRRSNLNMDNERGEKKDVNCSSGGKGLKVPSSAENGDEGIKDVAMVPSGAGMEGSFRDPDWEIQDLRVRLQEVERLSEVRVAGLVAERDASLSQVSELTARIRDMMRALDTLGITAEQIMQVGGEKPLFDRSDSMESRTRRRTAVRDSRRKRSHTHSRTFQPPNQPARRVAAIALSAAVAAFAFGSKVISRR
ncbi:hypothetical protein CBR_g70696 [Chara braunii]|uniref:Uncharacterized protein n=1 Tax=Chara braunii TaxID=69332 RepID=A0A388K9T6_CHABU|nr:hypothetical protein CBR_g70696 [Chara braunii]|eukprot:GBG66818.1 hypothetical protein CBR_g70696 [Chara braunii]